MKHLVTIKNLEDLSRAAGEFLEKAGDARILALYGQMGAGKTTFTVALCRALGVQDNVCSPTFTIISEYRDGMNRPVYHFDFYRIKQLSEAMDIGVEDYFFSGERCIIEWPENIEELLPDNTLKVHIEVNPDHSRSLVWED